jgi:hypothetical protein
MKKKHWESRMDWNSLISAVIGGLLAVIPVLITIRNQAKERDKDRQEQRTEAKTQLALELKRNDIRTLEEYFNNQLKGLSHLRRIRIKHVNSNDALEKIQSEFNSKLTEDSDLYKLVETNLIVAKLALTIGDEFYSEYNRYANAVNDYISLLMNMPKEKENPVPFNKLILSAGKLHTMLQEKLISIRDS